MPVPFATAVVDTTGDGLPNITVTSVDLNLDGIPDVLQVLQAIPITQLTLAITGTIRLPKGATTSIASTSHASALLSTPCLASAPLPAPCLASAPLPARPIGKSFGSRQERRWSD